MGRPMRIGFMGAGWPCQRHAEAFLAIPTVKLAAVSEPNVERRQAFVQSYGEMQQYDDYLAMLRNAELDAVVVGLPTGMHFESCRDAIKAGCHVLCEKPPTTTAAEMITIAQRAKKAGLIYMFSRQPRFNPGSLAAHKMVAQGKIGDIYHAEAKWIRARGIPFGAGGWFVNKSKGGGVLLDLGIHAIDNAWFIMGAPRPVEVFAGLHCAFSHLAPKGVEYTAEDAAVGLVRFANGATLNFAVTFALNTPGRDLAVSGASRPTWQETLLYGTRGGIDVIGERVAMGRNKDVHIKQVKVAAPKPHPMAKKFEKASVAFLNQARDFVRAVRTGSDPMNSADQAVMLMQMLEALRKSGETGSAVRISAATGASREDERRTSSALREMRLTQ